MDLDMRGRLAVDRTKLANERTLLAYIRTSLGLFLVGLAMFHMPNGAWLHVVGGVFVASAPVTLVLGIASYRGMKAKLGTVMTARGVEP